MKRRNYIIWGLIICLLLQIVVLGIAAAAEPASDDLTNQPAFLVIHNTKDTYESGQPSVISVKKPDNSTIDPVGGVYDNIPAGSKLNMMYRFHLNDGVEPDMNIYKGSNYFIITLPEDIDFDYDVGDPHDIVADPETAPWVMGTWTYTASNTIIVDFSDEIASRHAMWGEIGIGGTFESIEYGDETDQELKLGSETFIFRRSEPPAPKFTLEKSGAYNAASNTIEWTVTVTPPTASFVMDGYQLVDDFSDNQSYVADSFAVTGSTFEAAGLSLDVPNHTVTYTFPNTGIKGAQVIKYKTSPLSFASEDGTSEQSTFTNAASVKKGTETAIGPVTATVTTDWITKSAPTDNEPNAIRWEVTARVPNNGTVTGAYILDTLPLGMILDTSHPVQISLNGGTLTTVESTTTDEWGKYAYTAGTFGSSGTSGTLKYLFPSSGTLNRTARLVYYTLVGDKNYYIDDNSVRNFRNTAQLEWSLKPVSTDPPSDYADGNIPGNGLIGKTAENTTSDNPEHYNHNNLGFIHWTITVNRNKVTMTDAYVMDTIPAGQELVIDADGHAFTVKKNGSPDKSYTDIPDSDPNLTSTDNHQFKYTFPASFTDTYTLDYYTQIIDTVPGTKNDTSGLDTLYSNGDSANRVSFGDTVKLFRNGSESGSSNPSKTFNTQMIAKSVGKYDYTDHTVKWTVSVNRNRMPLTNAYVTELLPAGMDLLIDATHSFELYEDGVLDTGTLAPTTVAGDGRSFVCDLGEKDVETTSPYTITFYTRLQNAQLETQWSGPKVYVNNAQLSSDNYNGHIDASASIGIENPVISKSRTYTAGSDSIDWTIAINAGLITLDKAYVTDKLDVGLELEKASLKLYEVSVDKDNGAVGPASSGVLVTSGYTVDYPSTSNANTLIVRLPQGSTKAYRLEFTTFIISDDLNFTNKAVLSGSVDSPAGDDDAQSVVVNNLWSSGGSGSQTLTVYKDDGYGNPVPGSIYQLFNFNKQPILKGGNPVTATTNASGKAVFTGLPAWVFYAKEIYAPDGFLLNPDMFGGERLSTNQTFNTADASALGTLSFNKTNHKGAALSGGVFTLTGKTFNDVDVSMTSTSVQGTVTFTKVPIGTYEIRETSAPAGYNVSDAVLTATVEYADISRLAVKSTVSAAVMVNQPVLSEHFGSIRLKKMNGAGKALADAEFGLYNSDGALVMNAVSRKDGTVVFAHVQFGQYVIRETKAPKGYALGFTDITVTVDEDDVTFDAGTVVNVRDTGSPETGDDIMGYFVLALGSLTGIAVVYAINKRIKKVS